MKIFTWWLKIIGWFFIFSFPEAFANEVSQFDEKTTGEKIRFLSVSELMSPGFKSTDGFVPNSEGESAFASNASGYHWIDYEIFENKRLLYWQRTTLNFVDTPKRDAFKIGLLDPRFGFRFSQVIPNADFTTNYDVFVQPGVTDASNEIGRNFDFGLRTNTSYTASGSKWTFGLITESTASFYRQQISDRNSVSGFLNPFAFYNITQTFSTLHWIVAPFSWSSGPRGGTFDLPYIQNGLGWVVTPGVWIHVYLNNYLNRVPSIENSWASLWLVFYKS